MFNKYFETTNTKPIFFTHEWKHQDYVIQTQVS